MLPTGGGRSRQHPGLAVGRSYRRCGAGRAGTPPGRPPPAAVSAITSSIPLLIPTAMQARNRATATVRTTKSRWTSVRCHRPFSRTRPPSTHASVPCRYLRRGYGHARANGSLTLSASRPCRCLVAGDGRGRGKGQAWRRPACGPASSSWPRWCWSSSSRPTRARSGSSPACWPRRRGVLLATFGRVDGRWCYEAAIGLSTVRAAAGPGRGRAGRGHDLWPSCDAVDPDLGLAADHRPRPADTAGERAQLEQRWGSVPTSMAGSARSRPPRAVLARPPLRWRLLADASVGGLSSAQASCGRTGGSAWVAVRLSALDAVELERAHGLPALDAAVALGVHRVARLLHEHGCRPGCWTRTPARRAGRGERRSTGRRRSTGPPGAPAGWRTPSTWSGS